MQPFAQTLWNRCVSAQGTLAATYLTARGIAHLAASPALRFCNDTSHPEQGRHPAMVAAAHTADGILAAVHRTYLHASGARKAHVTPTKASLGPTWGAAIRLHPAAQEIVIGEGIETSGAAGLLLRLPAWAAISAGNLARGLLLPPEIQSVVIAADPDAAGDRAAQQAALRWRAEGRHVRIERPVGPGDFADILLERQRRG